METVVGPEWSHPMRRCYDSLAIATLLFFSGKGGRRGLRQLMALLLKAQTGLTPGSISNGFSDTDSMEGLG